MEVLNMKEESRERIHKMKVDKLGIKLNEAENKAREKYGVKAEPEKRVDIAKEIKRHEAFEKSEKERAEKESKKETKKKTPKNQLKQKNKKNLGIFLDFYFANFLKFSFCF